VVEEHQRAVRLAHLVLGGAALAAHTHRLLAISSGGL
jgi:hypothetical protein